MWDELERHPSMRPALLSSLAVGAVAVLLPSCSVQTSDESTASQHEEVVRTTYEDINDFFAGSSAWYDVVGSLAAQLAAHCATTTCSKTYPDLRQLDLDCSVSSIRGSVNQCTWVLAGSREVISAKSGEITTDDPYFLCKVEPSGTAAALLTAMQDPSSLTKPLPGLTTSLLDTLAECLTHPTTQAARHYAATGSFEDATMYLGAGGAKGWASMLTALDGTFDDVCGDTFCGSDYGDLEPLSFRCSAEESTGQIGSCLWVFGGSFAQVTPSTGNVKVTTKPFACPVAVTGTVEELVSTLTAPGSVAAIQRPLPGMTTSAYDAIGGCLP
jgi:hypothetical protein